MTPDQQQAVNTLRGAVVSRYPDVSPVVEESGFGIVMKLGVPMARFGEIEAAMQGTVTDIMLSTGVLIMMTP